MTSPTTDPVRTAGDGESLRECSLCGKLKLPSKFYAKGGRINQLERRCKACFNLRNARSVSVKERAAKDKLNPLMARKRRKQEPSRQEHCRSLARQRVASAIKSGVLTRPEECSACGSKPGPAVDGRSQIQAHHHLGYDRALDVQWLCVPCHRKETPVAMDERSGTAKITTREANTIRLLSDVGMAQREIAKIFRLGRTTVRHCIAGHSWTGEPRWTK